MTATTRAEAAVRGGPPRVGHIVTVVAYDFLVYAFFARQIGQAFFPASSPTASLLAALAAFGAGFLMRPLGALVIGRLADKIGRGAAMRLSFALMGAATVGLALTPSQAMIGAAGRRGRPCHRAMPVKPEATRLARSQHSDADLLLKAGRVFQKQITNNVI